MKEEEADGALRYARRPMFLINNLNTILTQLSNQRKEDRAIGVGLGLGPGGVGGGGSGSGRTSSGKRGGPPGGDVASFDELMFSIEQM